MKLKETETDNISISNPNSNDFDPNVTFLQIPVRIKDQVLAYIHKLTEEDENLKKYLTNNRLESDESGCFFVISLERIEELMDHVNACIQCDSTDPDEIKEGARKAMTILRGQ